MSTHPKHLQGLQIPGGVLPKPLESRGWLATFLLREAILLCPDSLTESEEATYVNAIGRFVVSSSNVTSLLKLFFDFSPLQKATLTGSQTFAGGASYRTPYLLIACSDTFTDVIQRNGQVKKQDLLETLCVNGRIQTNDRNVILGHIRLTSFETTHMKNSLSLLFWLTLR